jgi:hypothetical protein
MTQLPNLLLESLISEPTRRDGTSGTGGPEADCAGAYESGLRSSLFAIGSASGRQIS